MLSWSMSWGTITSKGVMEKIMVGQRPQLNSGLGTSHGWISSPQEGKENRFLAIKGKSIFGHKIL